MYHVHAVDEYGKNEYDMDCQRIQDAKNLCNTLVEEGGFFSTFITYPDGRVEQVHPTV